MREMIRGAVKNRRIYCDGCVFNGNCQEGGPMCERCDEIALTVNELTSDITALVAEGVRRGALHVWENNDETSSFCSEPYVSNAVAAVMGDDEDGGGK